MSNQRRRVAVVAISAAVVLVVVGVAMVVVWADGDRRDRNDRLDDLDEVATQLLGALEMPLMSNDRLFGGWCLVGCEQHVQVEYFVSPKLLQPKELCAIAQSALKEVLGRSTVTAHDPPTAGILECRLSSTVSLADGTRAGVELTVANSSAPEPSLVHFWLSASP